MFLLTKNIYNGFTKAFFVGLIVSLLFATIVQLGIYMPLWTQVIIEESTNWLKIFSAFWVTQTAFVYRKELDNIIIIPLIFVFLYLSILGIVHAFHVISKVDPTDLIINTHFNFAGAGMSLVTRFLITKYIILLKRKK